jgi:hypothetical protein
MIFDLFYWLNLSQSSKIIWVTDEDTNVSSDITESEMIHSTSFGNLTSGNTAGFDVCFFDLPRKKLSKEFKAGPSINHLKQLIVWDLNIGFWARKVIAPIFSMKDQQVLNAGYLQAYNRLLPGLTVDWEVSKTIYVYRFNEDALMLCDTDVFLNRFDVWSSNSKRNRILAWMLQFKPCRAFLIRNWPYKLKVLQKISQ